MALEEDKSDVQTKEMKKLSLLNNLHKLTPQIENSKNEEAVAIVNALKSDGLLRDAHLQLEGYVWSPRERKHIQYRPAIMNNLGIGNFLSVLSNISKTIEFSSFKESDIGKMALHLIKANYPYFTIYSQEYDLDKKDFNLIYTLLFNFIVSSLNKAKGSGHRNVVRGTYSEDLMGRFIPVGDPQERKGGRLSIPNLFKRSKDF